MVLTDEQKRRWDIVVFVIAAAGRFVLGALIGSLLWYLFASPRRGGGYREWMWTPKIYLAFAGGMGTLIMLGGRAAMKAIFGRLYDEDHD